MSATRTQIYLTEEQRQAVDAVAAADGITMAEVVRRALDAYPTIQSPLPPCRPRSELILTEQSRG